jgi:hypothetical protein
MGAQAAPVTKLKVRAAPRTVSEAAKSAATCPQHQDPLGCLPSSNCAYGATRHGGTEPSTLGGGKHRMGSGTVTMGCVAWDGQHWTGSEMKCLLVHTVGPTDFTSPPLRHHRATPQVLCLHGFTQNGRVFRERTGSVRKALKSRVDFVFVDGPHSAAGAFPDSDRSTFDAEGAGAYTRPLFSST